MSKAYKGGDYERELCKKLSLWWTGDRDDVFWRSSQSGGRATQRKKSGKDTFGSYGDIAAVDPIGLPLIKFCTMELKRGSSHGVPWDLVEGRESEKIRIFEACLNQARQSHLDASSMGWALLGRRDRKVDMIYLQYRLHKMLGITIRPSVTYDIFINTTGTPHRTKFISMPLQRWLDTISPKQIIECVDEYYE